MGFGEQLYDSHEISVYKKSGLDGHDGIDFALPSATPVLAVDAGKIILAKEDWIYGTSVVIEHSWGRTYYGHLSKLEVSEGDNVAIGAQIGLSGATGLATGPHLHFGLKPKQSDIANLYFGKIDPAPFFGLSTPDTTLSSADYPIAAKALVWNVEIPKGAEFTIGYKYKAPNKSPYFYTLGPLQFIADNAREDAKPAKFDVNINPFVLGEATQSAIQQSSNSAMEQSNNPTTSNVADAIQQSNNETIQQSNNGFLIFSEIRQWQLAIDATNTIILDSNADGTCGSGCLTIPSDWTAVNTIYTIGGGGAGDNNSTSVGVGGGGGGAYATAVNQSLSGNVGFNVGSAGTDGVNAGNTYFCSTNVSGCTHYTDTNVIVSAKGGVTATSATGAAGGDLSGVATGGVEFAGGAGGTAVNGGTEAAGGGGGAGSPNGTGGTGGAGDGVAAGDESSGGGGGSGCDSIGTANDGVAGVIDGGAGGNSCFASGGIGGASANGSPGTNGSGGGGRDEGSGADDGGLGGNGVGSSDPSLAGGGGGGGDDDSGGVGAAGGSYGGGGGGGATVGNGAGGVIVITYTILGPFPANPDLAMRHGKWFSGGVEQQFAF